MSDVSVDLVKALVASMDDPEAQLMPGEPRVDWEAVTFVLRFAEGYRSASGYAYGPDGDVTPVACGWSGVEPAVEAYLGAHYAPGERLPVSILVQLERASGRYEITFEEHDEDRWRLRPSTWRQVREELRPRFGS